MTEATTMGNRVADERVKSDWKGRDADPRPRPRSGRRAPTRLFLVGLLASVVLAVGAAYVHDVGGWADVRDRIRSSAQTAWRGVGATSRDAALSAKIRTALALSKSVSAFGLRVDSGGGYVMLTGQVPSEEMKQRAEVIVRDTLGVRDVHNDLTVERAVQSLPGATGSEMVTAKLPTGTADNTAQTLARRVEFDLYLTNAIDLGAIQIQATNGTVVLTGSTRSQAEKLLAGMIALNSEGVHKVVNRLEVPPGVPR